MQLPRRQIKAVRLGHPARIQREIQKYSLESLVQASEGTEIVRDCRCELNGHLKTLSNPKARPSEKRMAYREMKTLRKEIRNREEKVVGEILRDANVVMATNVGAASSVFKRMIDGKGEAIAFDLVIIDEAAQALEASCWISLLRGKRAVLAGDHKQLPPTIKSSVNEVQRELGRTLFERLMTVYERSSISCSRMLEVQYRMHRDIADWSSTAMYGGRLISHESVSDRKLASLPQVIDSRTPGLSAGDDSIKDVALMLIDTTGCDMHEIANDAGSRYNEGESNIVSSHVRALISLGLRAEDIAVITPYNGQVELLRRRLLPDVPKLEIRSVDGFQGGEREAVILSLVRSSERGGKDGIGFLRDERRLNVAVTRAKRHCALICDCETVSQNEFIKSLIDWIEEKGSYHSAMEFVSDDSDRNQTHFHNITTSSTAVCSRPNTKKHPDIQISKQMALTKNRIADPNSPVTARGKEYSESSRSKMMEEINTFASSGRKGDELSLGDNLPSLDGVVARELAQQLGLGVIDHKDRGIVLSIIKDSNSISIKNPTDELLKKPTKFSNLAVEDDSSASASDQDLPENTCSTNNLLRDLAREREQRQNNQAESVQPVASSQQSSKKKKNRKKATGGKVGGAATSKKAEDNFDDLNDMDFLDKQIDLVQNSHGRKIEASGKGYRSVMNGILLASAPKQEAKKDSVVSASLQAKIRSKAQGRQVKKKKK